MDNPIFQQIAAHVKALFEKSGRIVCSHDCSCPQEANHRREQVLTNLLKVNGFPVGTTHLDALVRAVKSGQEPQVSDMEAVAADLAAVAGPYGTPHNNAGLYKGRIAEIDPVKWDSRVQPHRAQDNHNMTNLTFPSLSDCGANEIPHYNGEWESLPSQDDAEEAQTDAKVTPITVPIYGEEDEDPAGEGLGLEGAPIDYLEEVRSALAGDGLLSAEAAAVSASDWWRSLSVNAKRRYLDRHPNSKYGKAFKRYLERKKAMNPAASGKGKTASKTTKAMDALAAENAKGENAGKVPAELDNDHEKLAGEIESAMESEAEGALDHLEEGEELQVDREAAEGMHELSEKKGFFGTIAKAIKTKVSKSTLGAMGRFVSGNMQPDDRDKVISGMTRMASAMMVVGVSAGIAMLAGPGVMMHFIGTYVDSRSGGDDNGFDFSAGGKDDVSEPRPLPGSDEEDDFDFSGLAAGDDSISDEDLQNLTRHFLAWLNDHSHELTKDNT